MADDYLADTGTTGTVAIGGSASGEIEAGMDQDWFSVELEAGKTYRFDLAGAWTGDGTLFDPAIAGIYDAQGDLVSGTSDENSGEGNNARVTFTPSVAGTYYIAADAPSAWTGTYRLSATEVAGGGETEESEETEETQNDPPPPPPPADADAVRGGANGWGDITSQSGPRFPDASLDGGDDAVDYYRFTLTETKQVGLGLRRQDYDADLYLEDANGNVLAESENAATEKEWIGATLGAGTYYVRVEAKEAGQNDHKVRYGVKDADPDAVPLVYTPPPQVVQQVDLGPPASAVSERLVQANEAPAFGVTSYAFDLAENADGSTTPVALGTVSATDPESATLTYSIVAGNDAGLFEIDAGTGALTYKGTGEDHESGTTSYALTVRASDGSLHADASVTVSVTDVAEAPAFGATGYAFDLAENADGSTTPIALGTVSATDPESATLTYSIVGGNDAGLFEVDAGTGALSYKGTGEDYESGTTSYALTVRASDGSLHADVAVTVSVTDADPEDLRADVHTTGTVTVGGSAVTGEIETEGDMDWFQVELEAGKGYYISMESTGDDPLACPRVRRILDADGTSQPGVTHTYPIPAQLGSSLGEVQFSPERSGIYFIEADGCSEPGTEPVTGSYRLSVRENVDSIAADTSTTRRVEVDARRAEDGEIEFPGDVDWFAVDLVKDGVYDITMTGGGAIWGYAELQAPLIHGMYDADGNLIGATRGELGKLTYSAPETATYYIAATGAMPSIGHYELRVEETVAPPDWDDIASYQIVLPDDADSIQAGATVITNIATPASLSGTLDGGDDAVDYYCFTIAKDEMVRLQLQDLDYNADLVLQDKGGNVVASSPNGGIADEEIVQRLSAGKYYVKVEAKEAGENSYTLRHGVEDPGDPSITKKGLVQGRSNEAPAFGLSSYAFDLAENADGSTTPIALGTVSATDPENATVTYSIAAGNDADLFEIDAGTGALSYKGTGEDYESGKKSYELTVRAGDGTLHSDVSVTVSVTDVAEAPAFGESSYAFDLAENADGSTTPIALGTVSATDPENATVTYSIAAGNDADLFEIDAGTGALSYKGAGEDYESGMTSYELTIRASDGTLHSDVSVTVSVTVAEAPTFEASSYAFKLAENADGSTTPVALGTVSATDPEGATVPYSYSITAGNDADLFEIDAGTGALSYKGTGEDYESGTTSYELTIRVSDGSLHADVSVTVNVTDVDETADDTSTTGMVSVGGSVTDKIETN